MHDSAEFYWVVFRLGAFLRGVYSQSVKQLVGKFKEDIVCILRAMPPFVHRLLESSILGHWLALKRKIRPWRLSAPLGNVLDNDFSPIKKLTVIEYFLRTITTYTCCSFPIWRWKYRGIYRGPNPFRNTPVPSGLWTGKGVHLGNSQTGRLSVLSLSWVTQWMWNIESVKLNSTLPFICSRLWKNLVSNEVPVPQPDHSLAHLQKCWRSGETAKAED